MNSINTNSESQQIEIDKAPTRKSHSSKDLGYTEGALFGLVTMLTRHPFHMIWLRTQNDLNSNVGKIIKGTKVKQVVNGLAPSIFVSCVKRGSSFYLYSKTNNFMLKLIPEPFSSAVTGLLIGTFGTLALSCPLETYLMYVTHHANDPHRKGLLGYLYMKAKAGQIMDLWKASGPHCLQTAVFQATWFSTYQLTADRIFQNNKKSSNTQKVLHHILSITIPSVVGTIAATPFHTITARQNSTTVQNNPKTIFKIIKEIYLEEGLKGFGRGGLIHVARAGFNGVLLGSMLFGIERLKKEKPGHK